MVADLKQEPAWMSEEEYLRTEQEREIRHEYIDGYLYAMAGVKKNHARITANIDRVFGSHLSGKPCESFTTDVKVKIGSKFFYPDVMVVCEDNKQDYYTETPVIVVEVLSKSTRRMDETVKKLAYQNIPTLQEYVLIEQDFVDVEVCRRNQGWVSSHYFLGDTVHFEAIGLAMAVADIYERVENEDMQTFLAHVETIIP
ncbi:MAG: Uma2 family endonuclease [Methylovulum miyakonense]|uniref:Uma2 family endonuclease n=1 Tax=Methylovulum miyakonense TaxID=645578 RepID=UPI003BB49862